MSLPDVSSTFLKKIKRVAGMHSIFSKFLIVVILTILLTSLVFGLFTYYIIDDVLVDPKVNDMCDAIADMEQLWQTYTVAHQSSLDENGHWISESARKKVQSDLDKLFVRMALYEELLDLYVFIADIDGEIKYSYPYLTGAYDSDNVPSRYMPKKVENQLILQDGDFYLNSTQYSSQLKSKNFLVETGDYYGMYSGFEVEYMTITKRLTYPLTGQAGERVGGLMVASVPFPEIVSARKSIVDSFIIMTIIIVATEILVVFLLTKKITSPLAHLQKATERLAKGDFSEPVKITSHDEIGELVTTFNRMISALDNMDHMKNEFIANVSHELRTPMTSIGGFIDAIRDGVIPQDRVDYYLQLVRDEITRMNALVNELLDLARMQSGTAVMEYEDCDINMYIQNCAVKLEPLIMEKNIDIVFDFQNSKEMVYVDIQAIERVFINLIQNAIKFTPNNGMITIKTDRLKDVVRVSVKDTGIGIKQEDQERIFERFFKSDKSRSADKAGTGLGLPIVKGILRAHNQDIYVESELGKGSEFIFTLPRKSNRKE